MVNVLLGAHLTSLNPDIKDNEGYTAEDYINRIKGLPEGFVPTFRRLLADVRGRYQSTESEDTDHRISIILDEGQVKEKIYFNACEYVQPNPFQDA